MLLTGESGTGKDLAAKVIHYSSARAARPFMNITCSALPETLLESELFGHERGAFTGADRQKRGLLESADGGTVFLDEIGEMVPLLQAKLLRFLEEKSFKRVGGSSDIKVDVRVIAATNRSLQEEVKKGQFREDLFYRLNVMPVPLPPLRERRDDIPLLLNHYIDAFNTEFRKKIHGRDAGGAGRAEALRVARQRPRAAQRRRAGDAADRRRELDAGAVPDAPAPSTASCPPQVSPARGGDQPRGSWSGRWWCRRSSAAAGTRRRAATLLGLNRDQIRYRIEKFKLEKPSVDRPAVSPAPDGRSTVTIVPPAGRAVRRRCVRRAASTSRFAVARPRPVPRAFVVLNGRNSAARISGGYRDR